MSRGRPGGNPNIAHAGAAYQFPPVSPGEKTRTLTVRLPESLFEALESLPGVRVDHVREALREYLSGKAVYQQTAITTNEIDEEPQIPPDEHLQEYDWGEVDPNTLGVPVVYVPDQGLIAPGRKDHS